MKEPHLLLAGNPHKIRANLAAILDEQGLKALQAELHRNVVELFSLGMLHYEFALRQPKTEWRQIVSRLYYGAYNVVRSVRLEFWGHYGTEPDDHKKIQNLPNGFLSSSRYSTDLPLLRADRNLADYDHTATESDLVFPPDDAKALVSDLIQDARHYLTTIRGVTL
jgi:hypothetical protein